MTVVKGYAFAMWHCEAYGPDLVVDGDPRPCFMAGVRKCASAWECSVILKMERVRIHDRVRELAAGGDLAMRHVLEELPTPEHLLGGPGS
jgi:hypothetical protein